MFTLIILFLIFRAIFNPWRWHRPWGGMFWGMPGGMWRRPPMGGFGFGPGPRGFGPGPRGFGPGPGRW